MLYLPVLNRESRTASTARANGTEVTAILSKELLVGPVVAANR